METDNPKIFETLDEDKDDMAGGNSDQVFKKPLFAPIKGKTSLLHKYLQQKKLSKNEEEEVIKEDDEVPIPEVPTDEPENESKCDADTVVQEENKKALIENVCSYVEPSWKGIPEEKYQLEELKNGVIQRTIDLSEKSCFIFGRLETCDIAMLHPTVSRQHAALQYRGKEENDVGKGFYLYDIGSTHGTFLNKNLIRPRMYIRMKVGHMIKLGSSTRFFVLHGPKWDEEEESEFSVTQLKEQRRQEIEERKRKEEEERMEALMEEERRRKAFEERGVDWGMGEDADEETDLSENPFAVTTNEELYIDDPKKTLRGWFEREGEELTYEVEQAEKGTFCCKIVLPIDNGAGKDVVVEVMGKSKKETMFQCALEACRSIDRQGLLRQSHQEARKKQTKNWEENDFYDSDEDNFLDRTGQIEQKRQKRMRKLGKIQETVETYESLMEKHKLVVEDLQIAENKMNNLKSQDEWKSEGNNDDVDALDAFMQNLKQKRPSKLELKQCQQDISGLKKEEERLRELINIARPANLPELRPVEIRRKGKNTDNKNNQKSDQVIREEIEENQQDEHSNIDDSEEGPEPLAKIKRIAGPQLPTEEELLEADKKKKRNRPRIRQKQQKNPDVVVTFDEDYNNCVWTPPEGQTGDGRTSLNDKLGY